jgi:hypothetical protein
MVKRSFEPGFRISLHQKDLNLALSSAQKMALALPATALAQQLFNSCVAQGGQLGITVPWCGRWKLYPTSPFRGSSSQQLMQ